jgi:hypothetical protein
MARGDSFAVETNWSAAPTWSVLSSEMDLTGTSIPSVESDMIGSPSRALLNLAFQSLGKSSLRDFGQRYYPSGDQCSIGLVVDPSHNDSGKSAEREGFEPLVRCWR